MTHPKVLCDNTRTYNSDLQNTNDESGQANKISWGFWKSHFIKDGYGFIKRKLVVVLALLTFIPVLVIQRFSSVDLSSRKVVAHSEPSNHIPSTMNTTKDNVKSRESSADENKPIGKDVIRPESNEKIKNSEKNNQGIVDELCENNSLLQEQIESSRCELNVLAADLHDLEEKNKNKGSEISDLKLKLEKEIKARDELSSQVTKSLKSQNNNDEICNLVDKISSLSHAKSDLIKEEESKNEECNLLTNNNNDKIAKIEKKHHEEITRICEMHEKTLQHLQNQHNNDLKNIQFSRDIINKNLVTQIMKNNDEISQLQGDTPLREEQKTKLMKLVGLNPCE